MNTPVQRQSSWIPAYITLGIVWGCSFIFIKLGLEILTPFGVAFVRCALGALALLIYAKLRGISLPKDHMVRFHLWVVAIFINVIPGIFFALAETAVTSILAGIINAVTPLMTIIAILVINREENRSHHNCWAYYLASLESLPFWVHGEASVIIRSGQYLPYSLPSVAMEFHFLTPANM